MVRLDGAWPNTCVPRNATATLLNRTIVLEAERPSSSLCGAAVSPYSVSAAIQLPAEGRYDIEAYTNGCCGERRLVATRQIYVSSTSCNFPGSLIVDPSVVQVGQPVILSWCTPADVTSYRIFSSNSMTGPFQSMGDFDRSRTTISVTPLQPGPIYFYVEAHRCVTLGGGSCVFEAVTLTTVGKLDVHAANACVPSATTMCMGGGRFIVSANWRSNADTRIPGNDGNARAAQLTRDSGTFYFFDPNNVELTVKMIDGCALANPSFWFFAAGLTNLEVELRVFDTATNRVRLYKSPLGTAFQPILDTAAFPCR